MEIIKMPIGDIKPYPNNPRKNDDAVAAVVESIKQCGYCAPIVVDEDGVVLAGHTRLKALKKLGRTEAEVCVKAGMTEEQKKKYRLLDNKSGEVASWDIEKLAAELEGLDFDGFDFGFEIPEEKPLKERPEVEFSEILGEENNYVVLQFKTDIDWLNAVSILGIKQAKSFSTRKDGKITDNMTRVGVARVLDGAEVLRRLVGDD